MSSEREHFKKQLDDLIKPLRTAKWQADFHWSRLDKGIAEIGNDYGGLELIPDFQRGHVWTEAQQVHYIENCMRGVVASSGCLLQFNCPNWSRDTPDTDLPNGLQCVDGLQRYTAVTRFVRGELKPFGLSAADLVGTKYDPKSLTMKVAVHDFTKRSDLLEHYLSINAGGTPHSAEEIARVRALLEVAKRGRA